MSTCTNCDVFDYCAKWINQISKQLILPLKTDCLANWMNEWIAQALTAEIVLSFLMSKSDNWIIWKKILFMLLLWFSFVFKWCLQFVIRALNVLYFILTTFCVVLYDTLQAVTEASSPFCNYMASATQQQMGNFLVLWIR